MKKILFALTLFLFAYPVKADMIIYGFQPNLHQRFYSGSDRAFIGDSYNWSGVGMDTNGIYWATMISPSYFVSAVHWHSPPGDTLTFWSSTNKNISETRLVDGGQAIAGSDLWLGHLSTPVDSLVRPVAINGNPLAHGDVLYMYGLDSSNIMRMGRNQFENYTTVSLGGSTGKVLFFQYDTPPAGLGTDEALVQGGDSGGPTFSIVNGQVGIDGLHWALGGTIGYDTFVPNYIDALNAAMIGEQVVVIGVPEPSSLIMLFVSLFFGCIQYFRGKF